MDHLAIMKKSWGLTRKILSGEKTIESRWYMTKRSPWNRIKAGETVYFKDSGSPVALRAEVEKVLQFADLAPAKVKEILQQYGDEDGIEKADIPRYSELFKDKRYCILIFLKNPRKIPAFDIDKRGFGAMAAWISVDEISKIKRKVVS